MEIVTSWMEEGIQKGLQQGIEQGKHQGYLMFAIQQLKHKFGAKVETYQGQLEALSFEQLDGLAEDLLNFTEFSDLEKWITTHS